MTNKKMQNLAFFYECKICDYKSTNKYNYNCHILTQKHKRLMNANEILQNNP